MIAYNAERSHEQECLGSVATTHAATIIGLVSLFDSYTTTNLAKVFYNLAITL